MQNKLWLHKTTSRVGVRSLFIARLARRSCWEKFRVPSAQLCILKPSAALPWGNFSICGVWLGAHLLSPAQCFPSHLAQKPQELFPTSPGALSQPLRGLGSPRDGDLSEFPKAGGLCWGMPLRARAPLVCSRETGKQRVEGLCGNRTWFRCQTCLLWQGPFAVEFAEQSSARHSFLGQILLHKSMLGSSPSQAELTWIML